MHMRNGEVIYVNSLLQYFGNDIEVQWICKKTMTVYMKQRKGNYLGVGVMNSNFLEDLFWWEHKTNTKPFRLGIYCKVDNIFTQLSLFTFVVL